MTVSLADDLVAGPSGPVPLRRYEPAAVRPGSPTLLWLHGGGFFRGDLDLPESDAVARALAARGVPVVTVDYRLSPLPGMPWAARRGPRARTPFPLAHREVLAAYRAVSEAASDGVVLGGASAGACLAAAAALAASGTPASDDLPAPVGAFLAYGFFHSRTPRVPAITRTVRGHRRLTHAPWALDAANRAHARNGDARADPRAFPGGHPLDAFPPTLLVDAEHDTMRASGERFAAELTAAGVQVVRHVLAGSRHAFLNRPGTPDSTHAIDLASAWLATHGPDAPSP
ncbi:alpha/beta hydrolase [Curtobacterium sp. ZW137]|uniref:alpha/beta hydrolase n=1 Tax=Curtobacterium sp. ZW137 TaxID=2485104 RepID=UPI000F8FBE48|nr:alpha/beta fold hydrolase [Curtobacterium sp. ZW137]ROP66405.1 acetyl esterase/lipase [Curtobacterium sp. ZW137]